MRKHFPLSQAKENQRVSVVKVNCSPMLRSRLAELGLLEGCGITRLYSSAFGDPCAYVVKDTVLAIRKGEADKILCSSE